MSELVENRLPLLRVQLFGKERVAYGDIPILGGKNSITKAMKLLLILLYNGKEGIARNKLLEDLYGRESLADVANNLRVTVHRLKKMLLEAGLPEHEYVVVQGGVYYWDSPMETEIDVEIFKNLIARAKKETDEKKKVELLSEACRLYGGEFLQKLSGDEWVLIESVQCKKLYTFALQELCEILMEQREFDEVLRLLEPACEMYPFDEWQSVKIDCYIAMNRHKDALLEYEATAKMLFEELGVSPSERMLEQFEEMSEHISNRPQVISEIKVNLTENPEGIGAFFCNFPGFRDAYRVIRRGMERNGQSVFLVVFTLTDAKGHPMEGGEKLDEMSDKLRDAIQYSLRTSDSFTKYNRSQFLVMLVGTNEENCQIAINRICTNFAKEHKAWADRLEYSVSSLLDIVV